MSDEEKKACPFCGEEILATAQKCKHCNTWLEKPIKKNLLCIVKDFFIAKEKADARNTTASIIAIAAIIFTVLLILPMFLDDSAIRQCVYAILLLLNAVYIVISLLLFDKEK